MKTYTNTVIINGVEYTNIINASNYKEALEIQKKRKSQSRNVFKGKLQLS